jgi:hypothetical protein
MSQMNVEVTPSNVTSTGTVSFKSGNPVIQFIIGEQERLLLGQSVRFCGKFRTLLSNASSSTAATSNLAMSEKLGVYGAIDTLTIKSQRTGQTLESIRHYNRFLASYLPAINSAEDNMTHLYDQALILPNYDAQTQSVVNIPSSSSTQNHFCISLPCGLLGGGEPLRLDQSAVGGVLVELHLSPDSQVFHTSGDNDSASYSNSLYEFKDISLVAELAEPDPDMLQQMRTNPNGTYEYNSLSSYYQTINSANGIINFQLGLSRVLGVFANIVPASHINNLLYDGLATLYPTNSDGSSANIKELFFTRNGSKFPIDFNINTPQQENASNRTVDSQIIYNYLNAITKFADITRTSVGPVNSRYSDSVRYDKDFADGGCAFGIGVAFDNISDQGVDFKNVSFGMNLSLDLTTDSPQSFFVFVHSKNTLVYGPQGLQVIS